MATPSAKLPTVKMIMVGVHLPPDLLAWMDAHLARLTLALLQNANGAVPRFRPSRASFIRELLYKARKEHNK